MDTTTNTEIVQPVQVDTSPAPPVVKAKRGRRSKKEIAEMEAQKELDRLNAPASEVNLVVEKPAPKKRGRKPKGGKIVEDVDSGMVVANEKPNVILHLKCFTCDLTNDGSGCDHESDFTDANVKSYDENILPYHIVDKNSASTSLENITNYQSILLNMSNSNDTTRNTSLSVENHSHLLASDGTHDMTNMTNMTDMNSANTTSTKEVWKKLKSLEQSLHMNNIPDSNSACFWCSYDFDNPPIYIPKMLMKNTYHVYGCFCSPECSAAYLMKENIDSSSKFERYALLNSIYNKVFDYAKNIKPAPDPHYLLDRFCGNLTIQEYRQLLKSDRLFLVVDKPLTRVLPELHEDNDEFIINNKIIPTSNQFSLKKRIKESASVSQPRVSSGENFGIFSMVG